MAAEELVPTFELQGYADVRPWTPHANHTQITREQHADQHANNMQTHTRTTCRPILQKHADPHARSSPTHMRTHKQYQHRMTPHHSAPLHSRTRPHFLPCHCLRSSKNTLCNILVFSKQIFKCLSRQGSCPFPTWRTSLVIEPWALESGKALSHM